MKEILGPSVISIDSLIARSELIKKSSANLLEKCNRYLGRFSEEDIRFARSSKKYLSDHECAIIHLRFWENLDFNEISQLLKISMSLVIDIFEAAIKKLRQIYQEEKISKRNIHEFRKESLCKTS
jgi:DNA-directed RNA polymerase specialized sigma subunit